MIGVLHPGSMGAAVAAEVRGDVLWCPDGRSPRTRARAVAASLGPASMDELVERCRVIISVCPPAAAEDVARQVAGFRGIYLEANAISPIRTARIAELLDCAVVDGGVIGGPSAPRLYLAGPSGAVETITGLFAGSRVETRVLGNEIGQASGLKLAFASYNKASRALAAVAHALADHYGVLDEIVDVAGTHSGRPLATPNYGHATASAWRWGPEMLEVAEALRAEGLPDDFALAAEAVFCRWAPSKDTPLNTADALDSLMAE